MDAIITHEPTIRLAVFVSALALFVVWEVAAPSRLRVKPRLTRWVANAGLVVIDTLLLRIAFPLLAVGAALWASGSGIGLFNWLDAPIWLSVPLSILLLDCAIYWQHVLTHRVPMLWRLHRVHHSDHDVDVTTALRFHPFEIAFSMGLKIGLVVALGAPAAAVVLFEVILNGMAMFNHANARLPRWLERPLRWLVVTPEMHRIHHSQDEAETNSNYGFNLSLWDRIFGTYQRQSAHGDGFALGLSDYERAPTDNLLWTLTLPLETPSAARDSDDGPTAADKHA